MIESHFAASRSLGFCRKLVLVAAALMVGFSVYPAYAQPPGDASGRLAFEVASIKPSKNTSGPNLAEFAPGGQRFTAANAPLKLLIMIAYDVNARQLSGGPGWLNSECYDVEAKAERPASREKMRLMLEPPGRSIQPESPQRDQGTSDVCARRRKLSFPPPRKQIGGRTSCWAR